MSQVTCTDNITFEVEHKFHVCVEQPLAGGFQPNLANFVRLPNVIKRAKFHRYNMRAFGAVRY